MIVVGDVVFFRHNEKYVQASVTFLLSDRPFFLVRLLNGPDKGQEVMVQKSDIVMRDMCKPADDSQIAVTPKTTMTDCETSTSGTNTQDQPSASQQDDDKQEEALQVGSMLDLKWNEQWVQGVIQYVDVQAKKFRIRCPDMRTQNLPQDSDKIAPLHTYTASVVVDDIKERPLQAGDSVMALDKKCWHWSTRHIAANWKTSTIVKVTEDSYVLSNDSIVNVWDAPLLLMSIGRFCSDHPYISGPTFRSTLVWDDVMRLLPQDHCVMLCQTITLPTPPEFKADCNCEDLLFLGLCNWYHHHYMGQKVNFDNFQAALAKHIRWQFVSFAVLCHPDTSRWMTAPHLLRVIGYKTCKIVNRRDGFDASVFALHKRCACPDVHK
jgi:hypothetical protein